MINNYINPREYLIHFQDNRLLHIKIKLLNELDEEIDTLHGVCENGSIRISNNSAVRRTCNISMIVLDDSWIIAENKKIWFNRRINVFIGLQDNITDEIIWFDKGKFIINKPTYKWDVHGKKLDFEALDYMCTLDGTLGGILTNKMIYKQDIDISTAIRETIRLDTKFITDIENINRAIPYDIEIESNETEYEALKKLADLYMNWEMYFNEKGIFCFKEIRNRSDDYVWFHFAQDEYNLIVSYDLQPNLENVKNKIVVWGMENENTGEQIHYELINNDPKSPFSVDKIGVIPSVVNEGNIFTNEQAKLKAEHELFLHNNFQDKINITLVPLYFLDVNKVITFDIKDIGLYGRYLIDEITIPLGLGTMSIQAHKIYEN